MAKKALSKTIQGIGDLTGAVESGGALIDAFLDLSSTVLTVVNKALAVLQEDYSEEIKRIYQVKTALHDLKLAVTCAYAFLDKVDDVFHYCQSDSMNAARRGLKPSSPNLTPLRHLMGLLMKSLTRAETKYLELVGACETASHSCREAAEICARKERESRKKKWTTGVLGTASTIALVAGAATVPPLAASVIIGAVGIGTGVATYTVYNDYKKSEASFRRMWAEFDSLLEYAHDLHEEMAVVHVSLENIATQLDSIDHCIRKRTNVVMIKGALKHLNAVCTDSYYSTSKNRNRVRGKTKKLKAKFKCVY